MDIIIEEQQGMLWVAAMDRGNLESFEVDPVHERVRWGSIYWAKIDRIDTSIDAAFLNLDGETTGILYGRDVRIRDKKGKLTKGGNQPIGKLDLKCEVLFLRKWTEPLMPDTVKNSLGILTQAPAQPIEE